MTSRGTPRHAFRIPKWKWEAWLAKVRARGETASGVINRWIEQDLKDEKE